MIGSQAILAQFPNAPAILRYSREVDVFSPADPAAQERIDGALGELSLFDQTHGFYVHGVGAETAVLPDGWRDRLVPVQNENTFGCTGWCLEVHDLAASKLVAGRQKDREFVRALIVHGLANVDILRDRISTLPIDPTERDRLLRLIER